MFFIRVLVNESYEVLVNVANILSVKKGIGDMFEFTLKDKVGVTGVLLGKSGLAITSLPKVLKFLNRE